MAPNYANSGGGPDRPAPGSKRERASGSKAARLLMVGAGLLATAGGWAALANSEVAGSAQPDVPAAASVADSSTLPQFKTTTANLPILPDIPAVPTLVSPPTDNSAGTGAASATAAAKATHTDAPFVQQSVVEPTPTLRAVAVPAQPARKPLATTRSSR